MSTSTLTARVVSAAVVLTALIAGPSDLRAQDSAGMSWLPWSGCWVEVEAPAEAPMTCVVPGQDGATLLTITRDGEVERQLLGGDGIERPLDMAGCVGVEAGEFSDDGTRVYTRSRLTCEGGIERSTRGLIAMVAADEWIRVRALRVGQGSTSWVNRYRPAPSSRVEELGLAELDAVTRDRGLAIETARMAASAPPSVEDIIEAHARTDEEAVRAWIAEQGQPIDLDAERLIHMADAGVSEAVIDVAVAVTFPERFDVARHPDRRLAGRDGFDRYLYADPFGCSRRYSSYYDPFFYGGYDPFFYGARSRCYGYGYGYGYGRGYGLGVGYPGTIVVVQPSEGSGSNGRAVKGRGYTRSRGGATTPSMRPSRPSSSASSGGYSGSRASSGSSSKGKAKAKGGGGG